MASARLRAVPRVCAADRGIHLSQTEPLLIGPFQQALQITRMPAALNLQPLPHFFRKRDLAFARTPFFTTQCTFTLFWMSSNGFRHDPARSTPRRDVVRRRQCRSVYDKLSACRNGGDKLRACRTPGAPRRAPPSETRTPTDRSRGGGAASRRGDALRDAFGTWWVRGRGRRDRREARGRRWR